MDPVETARAGFPARPSLKSRIWGAHLGLCSWSLGSFRWNLGNFLLAKQKWMTRSSLPFPQALAESHPKKSQDSCIHLLRLHENQTQILLGKTARAWRTPTNPTPATTSAPRVPKWEQFQDSAPEATARPLEWSLQQLGVRTSLQIKPSPSGEF